MDRRDALRAYFVEVIRDLAQRGMLRVAAGQPLEHVLMKEGSTLVKALQEDAAAVLGGIGVDLLGGAAQLVGNAVQRRVENVFGQLGDYLRRKAPPSPK